MVKCIVSGCPNRAGNVNRGVFNRPTKRFFSFPKDPARVKVWLAALRETDKQDLTEQHLICEDHFLPEDVSASGVTDDAIPIMPPYLDGPLGRTSPWGAESSEEEEQCATGGPGRAEVEDDAPSSPGRPQQQLGGSGATAGPTETFTHCGKPDLLFPLSDSQDPQGGSTKPPKAVKPSAAVRNKTKRNQPEKPPRYEVSLGVLTKRFLELLQVDPDRPLELRDVAASLQTRKRRVYDITNVLEGINLIHKVPANRIQWIGKCPVSSYLWRNQEKFLVELENLKLVENTLDSLIKSCAQQLFDMTDHEGNATLAYVTHEDVRRLQAFQDQTLIVVKAPEETKLEIPAPREDSIQVHLKAGRGPIMVMSCEVGSGDAVTSDPGETSSSFTSLEESRIRMTSTEAAAPQSV